MTSFAAPEIVACPHCQQTFTRQVLRSFNNKWEVTYSDGGSAYGISTFVFDVARCANCGEIIKDVQNIPALGVVTKPPFWKRWFVKQVEYKHFSQPKADVYLELFEKNRDESKTMQYALQAYRSYNQCYRLDNECLQPSAAAQQQYQAAGDHILASPPTHYLPEYELLCADIFRMRGEFLPALDCYSKVAEKKWQHIIEQGAAWVASKQTNLMIIKSKEQHHEEIYGPIAPPENKVFCNIELKQPCSKHWNELSRVDGKPKQRFCDNCKQHVYHCASLDEFQHHSSQQHCIAADIEQLKMTHSVLSKLSPDLSVGKMEFAKYQVNDQEVKND